MAALNENAITMLNTVNLDLTTTGLTTLYVVPTGKSCVLILAAIIAGSATGASEISIGRNGSTTDIVPANTLSTTSVAKSVFVLQPIPSLTPQKLAAYPASTAIEANVITAAGGGTNTIQVFGYLF